MSHELHLSNCVSVGQVLALVGLRSYLRRIIKSKRTLQPFERKLISTAECKIPGLLSGLCVCVRGVDETQIVISIKVKELHFWLQTFTRPSCQTLKS